MDPMLDFKAAKALLEADRPADVSAAITEIETRSPTEWRAVGNDEANVGTIEMGAEPELQLVERVTNAQDAILELYAERAGAKPSTPRDAARRWLYRGEDSLAEMTERERRALAEGTIRVTLSDSGDPKRPTVTLRDWGIGQRPDDFPDTFVSLHRGNKLTKPHLIGVYGQGGATTFAHCEYTIIASRRAPDLLRRGEIDEAGITVVRYRTLPLPYKKGHYEYLCGDGGRIFRLSGRDADNLGLRHHGTIVIHVAYEMPAHNQAYRLTRTGLWALLNSGLFDTILPIHIQGRRPMDLQGDPHASTTGRVVIGNAANLQGLPGASKPKTRRGDTFIEYSEGFDISLESYGNVQARIWVIGGTDVADAFVPSEQAVTYTLSGQTQGKLHQRFLAGLSLGFLAKRMIVEVNFDGSTDEAKRALFPSVRERQRLGVLNQMLEQRLSEWLRNHDQLRDLEEKAREEAMAMASSKAADRLRKMVAERIGRALAGQGQPLPIGSEGNGSRPISRGTKVAVWSPDDSRLPAKPTYIRIMNSPLRIPAGSGRHLKVEINAKNGYVDSQGVDLITQVRNGDGQVRVVGRGKLRGGHVRLLIGAEKNAKTRRYKIDLILKNDTGKLTAVAECEVVRRRRRQRGRANTGLPYIIWRKQKDWPTGWDEAEVGDVVESGNKVIIQVNEDYVHLAAQIKASAAATKMADPLRRIDRLKNSYLVPVATGLWLQHAAKRKAASPPDDAWLKEERARLAIATLDSLRYAEPEA